MNKLRLRFKKTGRAAYISHLDLMHTLQRSFSRAGITLAHSEGFNPHPMISIALPLSVGAESYCEVLDFKILEGTADIEKLNAALPEGIEVIEIYEPSRKAAELKYIEIEGRFEYDSGAAPDLKSFFSQESIIINKRSKRGYSDTDIVPMIKSLSFESVGGIVKLKAVVSAQEPTFNPELFCETLRQLALDMCPDYAHFIRIETYDSDMKVFR